MLPVTFVIPVKQKGQIVLDNFLASPCLKNPHPHQILIQENFTSAAKAYNDAIDKSENDLIVFAHQDVILPEEWINDLERALACLEADDPKWGVIGCFGELQKDREVGYIFSAGRGVLGNPFNRPTEIHTLDELVLIFRRSSGLRFDDNLPDFHMYGADICLIARQMGRKNYAISAFCIHNTDQHLVLPSAFYDCCKYMQQKWKDFLPIRTTCVTLTKYNVPLYEKRLRELILEFRGGQKVIAKRTQDVKRLVEEAESARKRHPTVEFCAGPAPKGLSPSGSP